MQVLFDMPNFSCIMQLRAENQNLVSALSNYQQILYQFFEFTQNLKQSPIESLNASYRRLNRQRSVFTSSQALLKALYLATFEATKKWTMPIRNWGKVRGELTIMYPDRMPD